MSKLKEPPEINDRMFRRIVTERMKKLGRRTAQRMMGFAKLRL